MGTDGDMKDGRMGRGGGAGNSLGVRYFHCISLEEQIPEARGHMRSVWLFPA